MRRPKVLYVVHNHPTVRPGGAETYAYELYQAMRTSAEFEPIFLARTGPPVSSIPRYHEGTLLTSVTKEDPNQYFFYTDVTNYDWMNGKSPTKETLTRFFTEFLDIHQPDVVHFQHTLFLGYDILRATRNVLPDAPIVYTLHEYLPICNHNGQLIRTKEDELCLEASPRRCHECFPAISPQDFYLRERFVKSHFEEVDLFLAPSHFLRQRYIDWGIPADRIHFEDYGRQQPERIASVEEDRPRTNLGFFGQLSHFKGIQVLLKAMQMLAQEGTDAHLWIHGANLDLQPDAFRREFKKLIAETESNVTWIGTYEHHELPKLISDMDWVMVPSIWWENSPLVIQEAFLHNRPVICSDVGGMAEKVTDGVNGLHFRVRDPINLARTIDRAVNTPGLWEKLREGIPDVFSMGEHVANLTQVYRELLDQPRDELSLVSQEDGK